MPSFNFPFHFATLNAGRSPFPWQQDLFDKFFSGEYPKLIDLPTGTGKTSVMSIWLLALAARRQAYKEDHFPRRLVWVVDRRVVVDQVQAEAARIANLLNNSSEELAQSLRSMSVSGSNPDEPALAVTTLRGEVEDNQQWSKDPSRPAIIVGTVDMIGSRLLFSGYGVSWKSRPIHAALLAQDTLIVNDEAHLTPAFALLIERISDQSGSHRALRTIRLSATHGNTNIQPFPIDLATNLDDPTFAKRVNAVKNLELREVPDPLKEIKSLALLPAGRTAVFVRSPKKAREIAKALPPETTIVITGEMRGKERNEILDNPVMIRLRTPETSDEPPCWIVATSAAEVGMDFSVQRLITDLDTADHLIQRFGRLNRFGETVGHAIVIAAAKDRSSNPTLENTWNYLQSLNASVSPQNLRALPPPPNTREPDPHVPPLLPWQIDVWSMTSIRQRDWPDRPSVEPWLRGIEEKSPAETYVAWRDETADLASPEFSDEDVEAALEVFPVLSQEQLKQTTSGLLSELTQYPEELAILQMPDGGVIRGKLGELLDKYKDRFAYATLILPTHVGELDQYGMVEWPPPGKALKHEGKRDVSAIEKKRLKTKNDPARPGDGFTLRRTVKPDHDDSESESASKVWRYWTFTPPPKPQAEIPVELIPHLSATKRVAERLSSALNLAGIHPSLPEILAWSAAQHDLGKNRGLWQSVFRDVDNPTLILAKSPNAHVNGRALAGFRHELASVMDAESLLPPHWTTDQQDLALHLIACHHGFARPHFPDKAADRENVLKSKRIALQTAQRFSRLHRQWGPWTLAYLESILRSADAIASRGLEDKTPE